jgi:hypothetical protein
MLDRDRSNENSDVLVFPPATDCIFCEKTIAQVGGYRLTATPFIGLHITTKAGGSFSKNQQNQLIAINECFQAQLRGDTTRWSPQVIQKIKEQVAAGYHPWFCQRCCGSHTCKICGSPINYPMGCERLTDDGKQRHIPIIPFNPGCSNPQCENYKEWSFTA